ncbi:MAG TPA: sigma-70 family RNA polymerase sigma factor [Terriglobia bacterium]|nr:sigma-70 family RNA polymerase sigma factor [Terriglobia bacterium]
MLTLSAPLTSYEVDGTVESSVDIPLAIGERRAVTTLLVSETSEDAQLVAAARAGDRAAFGELYGRYGHMVHGILLGRVPRVEVDDLVHDVFLVALKRLSALRDPAAFGGWLAAIARHRAHDYHRRTAEVDDLTDDLTDDVADGAAGSSASASEALTVLAAIRLLPEAYRETLILRLVEGMTGPEIATRTGLTPGSVRVNLHRGMQQLRARLGIARVEGE